MDPQHIIDVCEANWDANKTDCNHFVKAVADALGVSLFNANDDADSILNKLASASILIGRSLEILEPQRR